MRYEKIIGLFLLCVVVSLSAVAQDGKNKKGKKANNDPWAEYEQSKENPAEATTEEKPAEEVKKDVSTEKKKADKADKKGKKTAETPKEVKEESTETVSESVKVAETAIPKDSVATEAKTNEPVKTAVDSARFSQDAMSAYNKAIAAQNIKRPVVKQADIKDPIDRKLKGPSGQTVYTSAKGGKYYINNIGVKTFLSGKE